VKHIRAGPGNHTGGQEVKGPPGEYQNKTGNTNPGDIRGEDKKDLAGLTRSDSTSVTKSFTTNTQHNNNTHSHLGINWQLYGIKEE